MVGTFRDQRARVPLFLPLRRLPEELERKADGFNC
jgi:hypothetical protein